METNLGETTSDHAVAGAVAGFVTRLLCQPFDVIKIRFQLQVEPISRNYASKYKSISQAIAVIFKEEGVTAFWKGHIPAQLLSITYGSGQFYFYNRCKKLSESFVLLSEWKKSVNFISGVIAGVAGTVISYPFDTVRTRLVAQSSNNVIYRGIVHPYSSILKTESPRSFFRGLSPALLQIAPHTGLQFMFYGIFVDTYKYSTHDIETTLTNSMIAGCGAGIFAKTIVYPFDLARKRLQIQDFKQGRVGFGKFFVCHGLIDCINTTLRIEGLQGLFKGLSPSLLKAAATTALHFTVYEETLRVLLKIRN